MHDVNLWWLEESQRISKKVIDTLLPTMRAEDCQALYTLNPIRRDDPVAAYFMGPYRRPDAMVSDVLTYLDNKYFDRTSLLVEVETQKQNNFQAYEHIWLGHYDERGDARVLRNFRIGYADGEPIDMPPRRSTCRRSTRSTMVTAATRARCSR
jgi:Phage terminase large subunit